MPRSPFVSCEASEKRPWRGFDEIPIRDVGYQCCKDRFKGPDLDHHIPKLNEWRLNLTGLSRIYNLYFVAYEDEIHVFLPRFPDQWIASQAALILRLPATAATLPGYMPYSKPHSVNNLLIAALGDEETLICACDDGDVIAYHTSILANRVDLAVGGEKLKADEDGDPKAFFHANVGASAWGLAVQAEHRMIAVSSNNHIVTVFSFGLSNSTEGDGPEVSDFSGPLAQIDSEMRKFDLQNPLLQDAWLEPNSIANSHHQPRTANIRYRLVDHDTNIPSITFCDSGEPSEWLPFLASTDIKGYTKLWSVTTQNVVMEMVPNQNPLDVSHYGHRQRIAGWGIFQLDKRAFAKTKSVTEAYGSCNVFGHQRKLICDISASKKSVRRSAEYWEHPLRYASTAVPRGEENDDIEIQFNENNDDLYLNFREESNESDIDEVLVEGRLSVKYYRQMQYPILSFKQFIQINNTGDNIPTSPLMLLHPRAVHLFQSPNFSMQGPTSPVIFLDDPLQQMTEAEHSNIFNNCDRLSLNIQIPELGVVLVGSPKGRVAVLTLHQITTDTSHPTLGPPKGPIYTMRLDHIIPFASQEESCQRPMPHLVGLAASPLRYSEEGKAAIRSWRILMMYSEHTILSYRIGQDFSCTPEDTPIH